MGISQNNAASNYGRNGLSIEDLCLRCTVWTTYDKTFDKVLQKKYYWVRASKKKRVFNCPISANKAVYWSQGCITCSLTNARKYRDTSACNK